MRAFYNSILDFIGTESLTDQEFATCVSELPIYDQASYDDLARVLATRDRVSTLQERLSAFYKAKGVEITQLVTAHSNIFLGAVL